VKAAPSENVVFDASVLVRATIERKQEAQGWVRELAAGDIRGLAPDLIWIEYANAVHGYVRHAFIAPPDAHQLLGFVIQLPLETSAGYDLAPAALAVAIERTISTYDACYVALAVAADATLVTADRRLADAYDRVELVA
jgi:predicted nucleic acid-binding protein